MENYLLYVLMCVLLIILPGPDTAVVTKNTLVRNKQEGFKTMLGTLTALMVHTTFAIVGLSAIIVKSALLFTIIKYIGAIYLVYLGITTMIAMLKKKVETVEVNEEPNRKSSYLQGLFTNLLNPKVAVFFLTFLPQFVKSPEDAFIPFLFLGITYTVLTFIWFVLYIVLLNQVRTFMKKPSTEKWMEGLTGSVLIGFGIKLALEKVQ
jgi:RhtB (resistance to homoserine/threonine) family protein